MGQGTRLPADHADETDGKRSPGTGRAQAPAKPPQRVPDNRAGSGGNAYRLQFAVCFPRDRPLAVAGRESGSNCHFDLRAQQEPARPAIALKLRTRLLASCMSEPRDTYLRWWRRSIAWMLQAAAVCLVIVFPALAAFDRISPWPPAVEALSAYPGQSRICVGYGMDSEWTPTASHSSVQRSFLLLPRALTSPSIIFVTVTDGAAAVTSESRFTFWFALAVYLIALIFSVRIIRSIISWRRARTVGNPNQALR